MKVKLYRITRTEPIIELTPEEFVKYSNSTDIDKLLKKQKLISEFENSISDRVLGLVVEDEEDGKELEEYYKSIGIKT